jgi:hypothetical protein
MCLMALGIYIYIYIYIYITSNHIVLMQNMFEINRRHIQVGCTQTQCIDINGKMEILIEEFYLVHMSYSRESHYVLEIKGSSLIDDLLHNIYSFNVSILNSSLVS